VWRGKGMANRTECGDNHLELGRHTEKPTVIVAIITCGIANTYKSLL